MTERTPRNVLVVGAVLFLFFLAYLAYSRPGYFTGETYLGGLLLIEFLFAAICMYRRVFFPLVVVIFLFAGMDVPGGSVWTAARWLFLGVGAGVGSVIMLKDRHYHFGLFHALASFAVLAGLVSAAVSRYPSVALLKVLSLLLLFVYGSTGARLAVMGRENRFFSGLLTGFEVFVGVVAVYYFLGAEPLGNPNSLGAVMGVVGAPILLWGTLLDENPFVHHRRLVLYAICMYLVFYSHARASIIASLVCCGLLYFALHKYKSLVQGLVIILILVAGAAIFQPDAFSNTISSVTSSVVYKGKDPSLGLIASRQSPWQSAIETIRNHFWFGTGFGTQDNGQAATGNLGKFSSNTTVSTEYGSSYLAITTWVGLLGVLPFFLLLLVLLKRVFRTVAWMLRTGNPSHPAVPLAMVMLAGMIHASLEDWLFAPGYYLCVFYWSMAFVFVDLAPMAALAHSRLDLFWPARTMRQGLGGVTPSR